MAYSELIKNFEKVRAYMREFYVYGFKSRTEYDAKSARSYDDERRRLESWLGDYMHFTQTPEGKNVFLSVDSRVTRKNPFYKAWKAKSFTDGDITLHFAIFDVLYDPKTKMTLTELIAEIDQRLSSRMAFDESTLRKKLKEYAEEGIIRMEKNGRKVLYSRALDTDITALRDVIDFFSEVAPCGVIGSFLQDRQPKHPELFSFKHHYITQAMDSDVMATLFEAIHGHRYITVDNLGKHSNEVRTVRLVPLKLYISAQNGRQNLLAFHEKANRLNSYRLDYMSNIRIEDEICEKFDALRGALSKAEAHMWGVNCKWNIKHTEHVEFEIKMEFNTCVRNASVSNFASAKRRFAEHGYRLPQIVFWNVASRNSNQPVTKNEQGVALVSGCTPRLFSMVASGDLSPYSVMMEIIESERYAKISA